MSPCRNYSQVLVLLLRLRQICAHPSLIQEDGVAYMAPGETDSKPEISTELTRARRLVSPAFVAAMKAKFKASAIQRMEAEKEVSGFVSSQLERDSQGYSPPMPLLKMKNVPSASMSLLTPSSHHAPTFFVANA
jgi:hypothetical protein